MIPFACGHNLQTARKRALCLEVTSIQLITSKRNVGSYMTIDWTLYFIRWSTLNLTRWALSENECSIGAPMLVPRQGEMPSYPYEPGCESRMLVRDSLLTPGMDNTRHFYSITAVAGIVWTQTIPRSNSGTSIRTYSSSATLVPMFQPERDLTAAGTLTVLR